MGTASHPLFYINRAIWFVLGKLAVIFLVWLAAEGMTIATSGLAPFLLVYGAFLALSLFYRTVRRDDNLFLFGQIATQWLTAAALIGGLSYVTARLNLPLTDDTLIAIDHTLFFDWRDYIAWVNESSALGSVFNAAYVSSGVQMIVLIAVLFLCKRLDHLQRFLLIFICTGVLTVTFAALFPAVGGYLYYDIDLSLYPNLHPIAAHLHEEPLLAMRAHTTDTLSFPMQGLVTFPSFHSALSIILIYAAWPIRRLRYPILLLNLVVLLSTPVDGGHYLTDILGGVAITLVSIRLIETYARPRQAPAP